MPRGGAQLGAGRKPGQKDSRPRARRTPAEFAADKAAAELKVKTTTAERMSALEFLSCVVANAEIPGCEQSPPYKFETQLMAAKTLIAYQSPRLNAITIDTREDDRRIEEIERLHKAALEYRQRDNDRLDRILGNANLSEEDRAYLLDDASTMHKIRNLDERRDQTRHDANGANDAILDVEAIPVNRQG